MKWPKTVMPGWRLLLSLPFLVMAGQGAERSSGDITGVGGKLFAKYCSSCHGMDGRGNGIVASVLQTRPADLTRIASRREGQFPLAEIAATIDGRVEVRAHGSRDMPVWGERFSEHVGGGSLGEEVVRGNLLVLVDYLRSIQR